MTEHLIEFSVYETIGMTVPHYGRICKTPMTEEMCKAAGLTEEQYKGKELELWYTPEEDTE